MKKQFPVLLVLILFLFSGCGNASPSAVSSVSHETQGLPVSSVTEAAKGETTASSEQLPAGNFGPVEFKNYEAFEKYASTQDLPADFSYEKALLPDDRFQLKEVSYRPGVYVMAEYYCPLSKQELGDLIDYDAERLQTLICRTSLFTDPETDLNQNYLPNGYQPVTVSGRTYYRWDEHAGNNPEARTIGYEIVFIQDGHLIFMHLPAVESFEKMLEYTAVEKIEPMQNIVKND